MNLVILKEVLDIFQQSSVHKLEIEENGLKIKLEKEQVSYTQTVKPPIVEEVKQEGYLVTSPIVGVYYGASAPEDPPFVKVGDTVKKGDTLCIIEAMKMMNEVKAPVNGMINKIYFTDEDLVEFGATIIQIEEDHV